MRIYLLIVWFFTSLPLVAALETTVNIPLKSGWNLVSLPLSPENNKVKEVLSSIDGDYISVQTFDGCGSGWKTFSPSAPPFINSLKELNVGMGFWVKTTKDTTLSISGKVVTYQTHSLCPGWNMVGVPLMHSVEAKEQFDFDFIDTVYAFDNGQYKSFNPNVPPFVNSLKHTTIGQGYWVKANVKRDWTSLSMPVDVDENRSLLIKDLSVVETASQLDGVWDFGSLIKGLAGSDDPKVMSDFVLDWLETFNHDGSLVVNGFPLLKKPIAQQRSLDNWKELSGCIDGEPCTLNFGIAPFRLSAIVNRIDLTKLDGNNLPLDAGEVRFVFSLYNVLTGKAPEHDLEIDFSFIFEYEQFLSSTDPHNRFTEWRELARDWHTLGMIAHGKSYNLALQNLVQDKIKINAMPNKPNGSALNQLRTNDAKGFLWKLREFHIEPHTGKLNVVPVAQTPDGTFIGTERLGNFINQNEEAILTGSHTIPLSFKGEPFQAGEAPVGIPFDAPNINNSEARHKLALNTCSGCHQHETPTFFQHVPTRQSGEETKLSGFLTGKTKTDPVTGESRFFNELLTRKIILQEIIKAEPTIPLSHVRSIEAQLLSVQPKKTNVFEKLRQRSKLVH
jgi:hypothetical protein